MPVHAPGYVANARIVFYSNHSVVPSKTNIAHRASCAALVHSFVKRTSERILDTRQAYILQFVAQRYDPEKIVLSFTIKKNLLLAAGRKEATFCG